MDSASPLSEVDGYKEAMRRYKSLNPTASWWQDPCCEDLVDFCAAPSQSTNGGKVFECEAVGGRRRFSIRGMDGFVFVPQALGAGLQLDLSLRCLASYCTSDNAATNIDGNPVDPSLDRDEASKSMTMFEKYLAGAETTKHSRSLDKLSWSTLGYQYDWSLRKYHDEKRSPFPAGLASLAVELACRDGGARNFTPQASIVNFYKRSSTMGGHLDDLEYTFEKPVVSISLGLPAIFLLGGVTKDETPIPILIRPGDVMIMGGNTRLVYHGMAKVLFNFDLPPMCFSFPEASKAQELSVDDNIANHHAFNEREIAGVQSYLTEHRINVNIRQVLDDHCGSIEEQRRGKKKQEEGNTHLKGEGL